MFFASFLIGLREGLEAALIIGILVAFAKKENRTEAIRPLGWGVAIAVALSLLLGALFTFGSQKLSFESQEIIGGGMSLLAVAMITWMVFWLLKLGANLKNEIEESAHKALKGERFALSMALIAFVSVGREGIETTLLLWGWALQPAALIGALVGIIISVFLGYLAYRGLVRLNLRTFFTWTVGFLVIVAAGILAYGIHDLQEARILPGPFSGAPITPTDFRTGEVLVGFFTQIPYWGAAYPFGWAFDLQDTISPDSALATFLKGTIGFTPMMTWLEVTAWALYLLFVFPAFLRRARAKASTCTKCEHKFS
ncbi:FTR1 family protein [Gleimia coleocanis DSM 15436]|uniref:FTR1 family protein n=1 Tax=Gleimia coleocanis DSM 15436 TaxID=525245 RepID=C0W1Y2_9ACTO|nr:iron uptake transporter permease EfeU [Gleimia coleocanis]EEH63498.1 FTR1 family protein [Gleimia coleocanis DSM 15436]